MLIRATAARAGDEDARALTEAARRIDRATAPAVAVAAAGGEPLVRLMERHLDHTDATWCEREFEVVADRERARFAAWYEFFPRSSGTFKDAETQLERAAAMGFDVVYLRSEEHTSELQSRSELVCRLLLEKKKSPRQSNLNTCARYFHTNCRHYR